MTEEKKGWQVDPLTVPCEKCRVKAGEKCKNYKGKGKQACRVRAEAATQEYLASQPQPEVDQGEGREG